MPSNIEQVAGLQRFIAGKPRLAGIVLRSGEVPHPVGYDGLPVPADGGGPMDERTLQLVAQTISMPQAGELAVRPADFCVREVEYLQRFLDPSAEGDWRFRMTSTRNASRLLVLLSIIRPERELAGIAERYLGAATAAELATPTRQTAVAPEQALAMAQDSLLVVRSEHRPLAQLYCNLLLAASVAAGHATVAVEGSPLFDLRSGAGLLSKFSCPGDLEDPLSVLDQHQLMSACGTFYTDMPESFGGHEELVSRLGGKAVIVAASGLRNVEPLLRRYEKKHTVVLTVSSREKR